MSSQIHIMTARDAPYPPECYVRVIFPGPIHTGLALIPMTEGYIGVSSRNEIVRHTNRTTTDRFRRSGLCLTLDPYNDVLRLVTTTIYGGPAEEKQRGVEEA